jgi:hypothetical protein
MKEKTSRTLIGIIIVLALSYMLPHCLAEDYGVSYKLLSHPDRLSYYRLNVVVPQSLNDYYSQKSHRLASNDDFSKFVTPYALKPIADNLWKIYEDEEDFANGVLMIVHQIPYEETAPTKYPVETITENKGDCDLFSFIAAALIKAGGLDVVLLYYEQQAHMNIGVHLSHEPRDTRGPVCFVKYNGVTYYVAECTGENLEDGWRVGERPQDLEHASAQIISLENSEEVAPGQVSASYTAQEPTSISLKTSPTLLVQGGMITINGQLTPVLMNKNVTIYVKVNDTPWRILGTTFTMSDGRLAYTWKVETAGTLFIRASWSGDDVYAAAISPTQTVTVIPSFLIYLLTIPFALFCLGVVAVFVSKHSQREIPEPQPPQVP